MLFLTGANINVVFDVLFSVIILLHFKVFFSDFLLVKLIKCMKSLDNYSLYPNYCELNQS